jgi:hypothetical protein
MYFTHNALSSPRIGISYTAIVTIWSEDRFFFAINRTMIEIQKLVLQAPRVAYSVAAQPKDYSS